VRRTHVVGAACFAGFVACVLGANWFIDHVGTQLAPGGPHTLPVGFGKRAPSGFVWVGIALTLRDLTQRLLGARWTVAAILVGALLSAFVSPGLAMASGVTFLVSEFLDFGVYTPLQDRQLTAAVIASNVVGAVADSVLFLALAFGWSAVADFALPQTLGKVEWSLVFLPVLWIARRWADRVDAPEVVAA
jgi:uncharacterized PurR-regulated membrane protein YhhQ (DUF165 family)